MSILFSCKSDVANIESKPWLMMTISTRAEASALLLALFILPLSSALPLQAGAYTRHSTSFSLYHTSARQAARQPRFTDGQMDSERLSDHTTEKTALELTSI